MGNKLGPERQFAFSARDRIGETVNRIRSVRGKKYHSLRNYFPDRHFASLNRYKEKCFPIKPLMRQLMTEGKLSGPSAALMSLTVPEEQMFDTENDPHEINNLANSDAQNIGRLLFGCVAHFPFGWLKRRIKACFLSPRKSSLLSRRRCTTGSARRNGTTTRTRI